MKLQMHEWKHPIEKYKALPVAAKAGVWFLICNFIQKGISALTTPIFTRLLTTAEFGRVNIFYSWADILGIFITFGLSSSVYARGLVKSNEGKERFTSVMLGLSLMTTVVSLLIIFACRSLLNNWIEISSIALLGIYAYVLFNTITEFWYQQKRVNHDYIPFVKLTMVVILSKPIFSILAILVFPASKVGARIIPDIVIGGLIACILGTKMIKKGKDLYDKEIWKESLVFVLPLIPHYLSQRVLSQSDRIMISHMIGESEAGIYSLAYSVGMLLMLLNGAMDSTVAPWAYKKIKEEKYKDVANLCENLLLVYGMCSLCFSFFTPEIVKIFAPNAYLEAIYIVPIIALSSFYMFSYLQFVYFEYYSGKTHFALIATGACAIINLILNFLFIQQYGYIAAAYTTLVCYLLYAIGHYYIMKHLCKNHYKTVSPFDLKKLMGICFFVSLMMAVCILFYERTVIRCIIGVLCVILTGVISLKILKGIERKE